MEIDDENQIIFNKCDNNNEYQKWQWFKSQK